MPRIATPHTVRRMGRTILFAAFAAALSVATITGLRVVEDARRNAEARQEAGGGGGEALVGGPFTLTDADGNTVTEAHLEGHWSLVFFGYTYCPDICPMTLQTVSLALDQLGARAKGVVPYFISVDPWRDTPEVLGEFAKHFHPSLVALTGTPEQVAEAASSYRAYWSPTTRPAGDDYLVDHTSVVYLMGKDGKYVSLISHGTPPEEIAARLREIL